MSIKTDLGIDSRFDHKRQFRQHAIRFIVDHRADTPIGIAKAAAKLIRRDPILLNFLHPEIEMYPHPHAKLRLVVDARRLHKKLPRRFA
jgi:hypothetical protein